MEYDTHPTFCGFRTKCGMTIEVAFSTVAFRLERWQLEAFAVPFRQICVRFDIPYESF